MPELKSVLKEIVEETGKVAEPGKATGNIPLLSKADTKKFGIAVITREGEVAVAGDADEAFSLQSISKVFSLTLALEDQGTKVWERVGREPSGDPFNSIIDLERHKGFPRNPFINAGALVIVDMLLDGGNGKDKDRVCELLKRLTGEDTIAVDEEVANSEESSGFTNRALANFAKSFDNLNNEVDDVIHAYVRQCSLALSCRQLAKAGRYLMLEGVDPETGVGLSEPSRALRINSLMMTCGQYDGSGEFAFRVGLPAKSGIGGGILAIAPNVASIGVWSPGLDHNGNSLLGTLALERLSERMGWSVFR
ncbi:glutaminase [Aureimonas mangrovi]|uniref:glutaminase n=1 Tax=Aureimonas mangrovi TaxID=2758041 RepID=UPI00163D6230|nr:glutaminase [Aureimonas mangrovi]